jgi:glycosyltransferase involved in cell wall biosynthesis
VTYGEEISQQIDNSRNICNVGHVAPDDIGNYLSRSRVLVSTSQPVEKGVGKEGFPNVFLEAWHFGVPVISLFSNPSGLLDSKELGILCSGEDEAVGVIKKITSDSTRWSYMSAKSAKFSLSRNVSIPKTSKSVIEEIFS